MSESERIVERQTGKEEKEEMHGAGDLPRPQAILDNAGAVLAVGQGRRRRENAGSTAHRLVPARA